MQALVDRHRQFVDSTLTNGKPVKFTQDGRDVIKLPGLRRHASCGVLYSLELLQQTGSSEVSTLCCTEDGSKCKLFIYVRLTIDSRTGSSIDISLNLNLTSQNIYSTLMCGLWIFAGPPIYHLLCNISATIGLVYIYIYCSLYMSFLAGLISNKFQKFRKI